MKEIENKDNKKYIKRLAELGEYFGLGYSTISKLNKVPGFPQKILKIGYDVEKITEWINSNGNIVQIAKDKNITSKNILNGHLDDFNTLRNKKIALEIDILNVRLKEAQAELINIEELKIIAQSMANIILDELTNTTEVYINSTRNDELVDMINEIRNNIRSALYDKLKSVNNMKVKIDKDKIEEIQNEIIDKPKRIKNIKKGEKGDSNE